MERYQERLRPVAILMLCALNIHFGMVAGSAALSASGVVGVCYLLGLAAGRTGRKAPTAPKHGSGDGQDGGSAAGPPSQSAEAIDPNDTEGLIARMMDQSRHSLLLRPQIATTLSEEQYQRALEVFHCTAALVPEGEVVLRGPEDEEDEVGQDRMVHVAPLFLDRYPVTNRQFYEFVKAGGYREMALWDKAIWPATLDMVDQTGQTGPRFWQNGCYLPGEEDLPVVGICWYEAAACARWLGKRLPTDAEWVKAACWPVAVSPGSVVERRYPWGDTMDPSRANLWSAGPGRLVAVEEYPEGVSVGGVYQMIGNVWEWTSGVFRDHMRSIRGGAFDTYFENQAAAQFQTGENPLGRYHNIGFRCAVGLCDLLLARPTQQPEAEEAADREPEKVLA
jgi:iron(II)-dependent oxidoreductase